MCAPVGSGTGPEYPVHERVLLELAVCLGGPSLPPCYLPESGLLLEFATSRHAPVFILTRGLMLPPCFGGLKNTQLFGWRETKAPRERRNETDWGFLKMFEEFLSHLGGRKTF